MMTPLGELFIEYERVTNPVTKSVYRDIIANRLNRLELEQRPEKTKKKSEKMADV